jgi:hypothetical protein
MRTFNVKWFLIILGWLLTFAIGRGIGIEQQKAAQTKLYQRGFSEGNRLGQETQQKLDKILGCR